MIKIDENTKNYLLTKGCKFGEDLHSTVGKGKKKTYYATENRKVISALKK